MLPRITLLVAVCLGCVLWALTDQPIENPIDRCGQGDACVEEALEPPEPCPTGDSSAVNESAPRIGAYVDCLRDSGYGEDGGAMAP